MSPVHFPPAGTADELRLVPRHDPRLRAGTESLCRFLGLGEARIQLFETGSLPVFAVGDDHVLKLYPAFFASECDRERSVLQRIERVLPVSTPAILAHGEVDGWRYLLLQRVPGSALDVVWPTLSAPERVRLAAEVGRLLATLHALDPRGSAEADWPRFLGEQTARCVASQSARGLAPAWLEQIPRFLAATTLPRPTREVLLHTEIMRVHLFAKRGPSGWSLSGLIDFEPAMVGAPEYEFAAVGLFLTCGDGPALRALLLAYGYHPADLGPALQRRLLAYALLHRYSNLRWYLERRPPPAAMTLDDVAAAWWAMGDEAEIALAPQHRP